MAVYGSVLKKVTLQFSAVFRTVSCSKGNISPFAFEFLGPQEKKHAKTPAFECLCPVLVGYRILVFSEDRTAGDLQGHVRTSGVYYFKIFFDRHFALTLSQCEL